MTRPTRGREILSNPFFVILLGTSVLFVITVLAYLASASANPLDSESASPPRGPRSIKLAEWFDRNGPLALGVEFAVMLVAGILAMATDSWFAARAKSKERAGGA